MKAQPDSRSGIPPAVIARQLGHQVNVTLTTYGRWLPSEGDKALVEKLADGWKGADVVELKR